MPFVDASIAAASLALALALRPWRGLAPGGPPWFWLVWCAVLPLGWCADRLAAVPLAQQLTGSVLLVLMCGWPLAVIALAAVALLAALLGELGLAEGLHRYVWLGLVPAAGALALGAAIRRWLPRHLFVYILGRGFIATALANFAAGALRASLDGTPAGLAGGDLLVARWLASWGDAVLTGMLVAIFVAYRPEWLATYADRLYLPQPAPQPPSNAGEP